MKFSRHCLPILLQTNMILEMASLLTLAICLLLGVLLQKVKNLPSNAHTTLGAIILYVPLPALCLLTLPGLEWNVSLISLGLVTWIIFFVSFFGFNFLGKKLGWGRDLIGSMILTSGFCNSAFVGFPVIEALYGKEALKNALFLDQAGTFLIVSTFGVWIAIAYSQGQMRKRALAQKIILFPPFISFLLGIILGAFDFQFEGVSREVLERLANLLTPLALICVGLQLKASDIKEERKHLSIGLSYKLFIAPMVIFLLYWALGIEKNILKVCVMESAMGPMITSSILAQSHGLRPKLAGMMVGVGIPLSFFTMSFWFYILSLVS